MVNTEIEPETLDLQMNAYRYTKTSARIID